MSSRTISLGGGGGGAMLGSAQASAKSALHSLVHSAQRDQAESRSPRVFVTVSRQPGAGGVSFSHRLAERLNQREPNDWQAWDKELVERVAAEAHLGASRVEMLEERPHTWFDDLVSGFSAAGAESQVSDLPAYQRVAMTVHELAAAGHAIIVGRGGVFVTAGMPRGVHLRLVAPLDRRVQHLAETYQLPLAAAAVKAHELERNQAAFFQRWWSRKTLAPEMFTMTLNSGLMSVDEMIETVLPVIHARDAEPVAEHPRWTTSEFALT
jgi:cytidylate kinase